MLTTGEQRMTSSEHPRIDPSRAAFLAGATSFALLALTACGGGGGGGGAAAALENTPTSMVTPDGGAQSGSSATYAVSAEGSTFGATPVTVSSNAVTVGGRTVRLDSASRVRAGHYRAYGTPGATSGPATEVHVFGHNAGNEDAAYIYEHLSFGSWAEGDVRPNPGFYIGSTYGAFVVPAPFSAPTRPANVPTAGSATFEGEYTGYVTKQGVGTSHVVGEMLLTAHFLHNSATGSSGTLLGGFGRADPRFSTFATPELRDAVIAFCDHVVCSGNGGPGAFIFNGFLDGAEFEVDPHATTTFTTPLGSQTIRRGDSITVSGDGHLFGDRQSQANSGKLTGGFFGPNANEAGGTYWFSTGSVHAAGAFGARRTD